MSRAKPIGGGIALLLLMLALVGAVTHGDLISIDAAGGGRSTSGSVSPWEHRLAVKARSQPRLKDASHLNAFAALKHKQPIPSDSRRRMRVSLGPQLGQLGIWLRRGYFLNTSIGTRIWVTMGHEIVCIFNGRSFAVACDTSYNTAKYGLVSVSGPSPAAFKHPPVEAVGIAPDGIRSVRLGVLGKPDHLVPVISNTFGLRTHSPIQVKGVIR